MLKQQIYKELDTVENRVALAHKLGKSEQAIKMAINRKSDVFTKIKALRAISEILNKPIENLLNEKALA